MMKYKKNYLKYFGYCVQDIIICEVCGSEAVDIHHVIFKSQRGTDDVDNLIGLCRPHHNEAHGRKAQAFKQLFQSIIKKRENKC